MESEIAGPSSNPLLRYGMYSNNVIHSLVVNLIARRRVSSSGTLPSGSHELISIEISRSTSSASSPNEELCNTFKTRRPLSCFWLIREQERTYRRKEDQEEGEQLERRRGEERSGEQKEETESNSESNNKLSASTTAHL